ncbi:hypothetical protein HYFRA_00003939 [Hymenoscyphus fraxineus]|uniref:Vacuolar membrane protein n=1 Tax=Hymenoscyphus fraxineus TaxID=746836 RepID=A0A9N9L2J7_9HELO|nr:hypothetical protein HYFRA_00003939 [Hymenoscyphus fraxineus]
MGCSGRVKEEDLRPEQKWDFISLNDFKNTSCFAPLAYAYLCISLLISVAVYGVDTFTAVNLLAFDRWSGQVQPKIDFDVGKWIFSVCIILSWVNVGYEHIRAGRVMKRGAVTESFLDSLAVRLQCIRWGKGRGYRRFLVFAELTKSKKGAEYVALFTYFSFQAWIRIIFCQGPRQVVNAFTLYAVFQANFDLKKDAGSTLMTFFNNLKHLAEQSNQQALILSGMIFTLVIWVFGVLSMILAVFFYVFFLWHYIPNRDGGLSGYCKRKVDKRLASIVSVKVNKAIEEEERRRQQGNAKKGPKKGPDGGDSMAGRQATLPTLFDDKAEDKLPNMPLMRADTQSTLPLYSSRPGTPSGQPPLPSFELNQMDQRRPFPQRSNTSYASNAPLIGNAQGMADGRASPAPSMHGDMNGYPAPPPRSMTSNTHRSDWSSSTGQYGSQVGLPQPPRMPSAFGDRGYTQSPVSYVEGRGTPDTFGNPGPPRINTPMGPPPSMARRTPFDPYGAQPSPALSGHFNPNIRSASAAPTSNPGPPPGPQRNMTAPMDYFGNAGPQRPGTSNSQLNAVPQIARLASPAPYNNWGNGGSPGFGPMGLNSPGYRRS